jgi:hypothetical protein
MQFAIPRDSDMSQLYKDRKRGFTEEVNRKLSDRITRSLKKIKKSCPECRREPKGFYCSAHAQEMMDLFNREWKFFPAERDPDGGRY